MKKRTVKSLLCAGMCAAAIVGTSLASYAATTTAADTSTEQEAPKDDGSVMAKITAFSGSTLEVVMAEQPGGKEGRMTPPADGETPPEKPADGETPPEKPADGETPPEKPADGETPPEKPADSESASEKPEAGQGGKMEMKFSEETSSLTITSDTAITKGMEHASASTSDLTEDVVVRLVLDGTAVVSIDIME